MAAKTGQQRVIAPGNWCIPNLSKPYLKPDKENERLKGGRAPNIWKKPSN
jgi:hypothetical protein